MSGRFCYVRRMTPLWRCEAHLVLFEQGHTALLGRGNKRVTYSRLRPPHVVVGAGSSCCPGSSGCWGCRRWRSSRPRRSPRTSRTPRSMRRWYARGTSACATQAFEYSSSTSCKSLDGFVSGAAASDRVQYSVHAFFVLSQLMLAPGCGTRCCNARTARSGNYGTARRMSTTRCCPLPCGTGPTSRLESPSPATPATQGQKSAVEGGRGCV